MLIVANVVVLAMLSLGASAYGYVQWRLGQVNRIVVNGLTAVPKPGAPITVLAVGSDTRNLGKGASAIFGSTASVTGQRSDTIMLVRIVPASSSVAIMSIPRDLLVPIAGIGTTRINSAFNSGPDLLVRTVQQDFGINVNHFMVVNFYAFTQIADSIGGVYQYFPTPARDLYSDLSVPKAGCILLKGSQALAFVRSREYQYYLNGTWQYQLVPESDLARIQRQQDFIKLAIKKAEQVAPTNPLALNDVIAGVAGSLTVDDNFSSSQLINLASVLRHANAAGIPEWTYPTVNSTEVPGALDPAPSEDQQMVQQFLSYGLPAATEGGTAGTTSPAATTSAAAVALGRRGSLTAPGRAVLTAWLEAGTEATGAPAGALATTPPSEVAPDASSFYGGRYIPPGLQPGQTPEKCPT
ncbi:MAG TPA: LCP family protein [Acidimicrobiales bacterium]|nr:LCP family protein [Acidimicrobiales bacterium]